MKVQIILTLALLAISASAYGIDIENLLATKQGGLIAREDLKYIIQSQYNQYQVVSTFFKMGDFDQEGRLSFVEFSKAYLAFIHFLTGKAIPQEFLLMRFELADLGNEADQI